MVGGPVSFCLVRATPYYINIKRYFLCCTECPADFTYIESVNGCYKVINRNLNWYSAGIACWSLHKDAHLLVINDAAEQHEIVRMLEFANG